MKSLSALILWAAFGPSVLAATADLLFYTSLQDDEYTEATTVLGFTADVVTDAQWRAMTTAEFAQYKAIIISDVRGENTADTVDDIQFLADTSATWSPAVTGNMIIIGTDPGNHYNQGVPGAKVLMDNGIQFAAAGVDTHGAHITGLYLSLSNYYETEASAVVPSLAYFGNFVMRGSVNACGDDPEFDDVHIVANSPALATLTDDSLSNWDCSIHETFASYPTTGINGFQALAIAKGITGVGSQTFGDGTSGVPYIISRGATPAGCGNGIFEPALGEECDDGNTANGDGCSSSCKCESGRPSGSGTCLPPLSSASSSTNQPSTSTKQTSTSYHFTNTSSSATPPSTSLSSITTVTTSPCPTPSPIGVEIIVYITVIESCTTEGLSTVTNYVTSACSTSQRSIYNQPMSDRPCYVCALSQESIVCPSGGYITVSTTSCPSCPNGALPSAVPPVVHVCSTCAAVTLTAAVTSTYGPPIVKQTSSSTSLPTGPVIFTGGAAETSVKGLSALLAVLFAFLFL